MYQAITRRAPVADRFPVQQPAPGSAHPAHWARPDFAGDVLAVAWAPGAAPPREIRVRPELYDRMLAQLDPAVRAGGELGVLGEPAGVPRAARHDGLLTPVRRPPGVARPLLRRPA